MIVIFNYLENGIERARIARQGKNKADALISSRCFWMLAGSALGADSLLLIRSSFTQEEKISHESIHFLHRYPHPGF